LAFAYGPNGHFYRPQGVLPSDKKGNYKKSYYIITIIIILMQFHDFLASAAGSSVKAGVLTALASFPSKKWTGNAMAKETGYSQPAVWRALHELKAQGLSSCERSGKAEVWQFNSMHVFAPELKRLSRPRHALADSVLSLIRKEVGLSQLDYAVLFGSIARGEETPESDIDLLVAYRRDSGEGQVRKGINQVAARVTEMTGNALSPIYYSAKEFKAKRKTAFISEAMTQGIVIYQRGTTEDG